ncbi:ricin B lectin domain-containing protein [Polychytrium aggregatum]|uniref:ricin B lectin domain-containing protein n=1 Tax=Polychytrium aggregatum TaxID=110093 RepID=UPI0022FEFCA8|nr:ricin B lectin domain-containing protein [Polychytrium aggregatum]KAI9190649.1 ricin B lectin domain-containing protein [Polychytrium aggregatum]
MTRRATPGNCRISILDDDTTPLVLAVSCRVAFWGQSTPVVVKKNAYLGSVVESRPVPGKSSSSGNSSSSSSSSPNTSNTTNTSGSSSSSPSATGTGSGSSGSSGSGSGSSSTPSTSGTSGTPSGTGSGNTTPTPSTTTTASGSTPQPTFGASSYTIFRTNDNAARGLATWGGQTADGTAVVYWDYSNGSGQNFGYDSTNQRLIDQTSMKCLAPTGGTSAAAGSAIVIKTCDITDQSQTWTNNTSSGSTWTWGPDSTKCLDLQGNGRSNGTVLDLWTCSGGANQNFYFGPMLVPAAASAQCSAAATPVTAVASTNSSIAPGTNIASCTVRAGKTNGRTVTALTMQNDGNLVIYNGTSAVWATDTMGQ